MNNNKHIKEYLDYYLGLNVSPEYAVMINGNWGTGKSWFIKNYLEDKKIKKLFVSLNGVSNTKEIEEMFFQQMHPFFSSKPVKIAGKIFKGFFKATLKIDLDGDGNDDDQLNSSIPDNRLIKP